jgi:hypothetical protein
MEPLIFKLQLHQLLHVPPQEEVARKFFGLEEHSRMLHHTPFGVT